LYIKLSENKNYMIKIVRLYSDVKLDEDELATKAANITRALIQNQPEFKNCELIQIVGITFKRAYDDGH